MTPPQKLLGMRRAADVEIRDILAEWADGSRTWAETSDLLTTLIREGHTDAHGLGREHAGDKSQQPDEDAAAAETVWSGHGTVKGEGEYWKAVDADVAAGKYGTPGSEEAPPDLDRLAERANRYTAKWAGTANDAWVHTMPEGTLFDWIMDRAETDHCRDCPWYMLNGPYTRDELPAVPGDGTSQCKHNCKCELRTLKGQAGFITENG